MGAAVALSAMAVLVSAAQVDEDGATTAGAVGATTALCDPTAFRFSVQRGGPDPAELAGWPVRLDLSASDLVTMVPERGGYLQYRLPLTRYLRCGPYTLEFTGAYRNWNIQGALGATEEFVAVRVLTDPVGGGYPAGGEAINLDICTIDSPRDGDCPKGWAVRLEGHYDRIGKRLLIRRTVEWEEAIDGPVKTKVTFAQVADDLSGWVADKEDWFAIAERDGATVLIPPAAADR